MVEDRVLPDVVALLQRFEDVNVAFLVHDFEVDLSIDYEVDVLAVFFESQDLVAFLVDHLLHVVLDADEKLVVVRVEVVDLLQQLYLELYPIVVVLQGVLLDFVESVRTVGPQFNEVVFPQVGKGAIVLTLDRGGTETWEKK